MPADDGKELPQPEEPQQPQRERELDPFEIELEPAASSRAPAAADPPRAISDTYDIQDGHEVHPHVEAPEAVPLTDQAPPGEAAPPPRPTFRPDEPQEPTWPDVVGNICLLLAGFGLVYHGLTLVGQTLDLTDSWHYLWRDRPEPNYYVLIPNMFLEVVLLCIELMLLYGGFAMKMRWSSCVATLKGWALVKMVLVILRCMRDAALLVMPFYRMISGEPAPGSMGHMPTVFMAVMMVLSLAWGLALPVFLLMMFRRKSIQDELATWD